MHSSKIPVDCLIRLVVPFNKDNSVTKDWKNYRGTVLKFFEKIVQCSLKGKIEKSKKKKKTMQHYQQIKLV